MVVAVVLMPGVEVARDEEVGVVAVRDGGMAAGGAMLVRRHVAAAAVAVRAGVRVRRVDGETVLVHVVAVRVMNVTVVDVVHVAIVMEPAVPAMLPMLMRVVRMLVARRHHRTQAFSVPLLKP